MLHFTYQANKTIIIKVNINIIDNIIINIDVNIFNVVNGTILH